MSSSPSPVRVVSRRTVKPPPRPRELIPLSSWDTAMLSANYIQKGLLFARPPLLSTAGLVDHLEAALADALAVYYPLAGRFLTVPHRDGCSVSVDCGGQGAEILLAVADGVAAADVVPTDADVPGVVRSFFPLSDAVCCDGHELPLFAAQVTELADGGVFLGFACNHALVDGTAFWNFVNAWAELARARLLPPDVTTTSMSTRPPLLQRWSPDGGAAPPPAVLPCADPSALVERLWPPPLRERMLHFSEESLAALKDRARRELLAAGDAAGAAAVTRFQALASLIWRSITRARRLAPDQETVCRASANNRGRLRPPLPAEYLGNSISGIATEAARAAELLLATPGGHGRAAAAVGRAVAALTDANIRARAAAWAARPVVYTLRYFDAAGVMMGSSPRFDMYGCDFGWGKPLAARSGKANKWDGKASLYPGRDGGIDAELVLLPEHMAALEQDDEFWAAVSPDAALATNV